MLLFGFPDFTKIITFTSKMELHGGDIRKRKTQKGPLQNHL